MSDDRFTGKVALVTGAGGGIGLATARAFAIGGACVALVDIQADKAAAAAEALRELGCKALGVGADVTNFDSCKDMVARAVEAFGGLHIAFNNAAIPSAPYAEFEDLEIGDWDRVLKVNVSSMFYAMKAEIPAMKSCGGTAIINTASMMTFVAGPGMASYICAKHGVAGLTKAAAVDLIKHGIRVNAVCPGFVDTPMLAPILASEELRMSIEAKIPAGRVGTTEEIANMVMFLASDEARYVVGSLMRVDGGSTLW